MPRLSTLKPRIGTLPARVKGHTTAATRITGATLQSRRKRCWLRAGAKCERCSRVVAYPHGFDLDHKVPLYMGGSDTDANCQVLCNGPQGCHAAKTREDAAEHGQPTRAPHGAARADRKADGREGAGQSLEGDER